MSDKTVQMTDSAANKTATLPVVTGTLGDPAIDIGKLNKETGYFTFDPGFVATAATRSAITYIDGDAGVLLYRGYPIEQLAKQSSFLEVAYLLINGELPDKTQFSAFEDEVTHHTMMHEALKNFLHGFHHDAHPMAMLCASIASLSAFYHDTLDLNDPEQRRLAAIRLIAKMPTIAAAAYRYSIGWPIRYPRNNLEYVDALPAHDVRGAERAAGAQPGRRQGARPAVHPARRSRAERIDVDGAPGRFDRRQSVRVRRRRHRRVVGPGARRRQRGGAEDARRDRRREERRQRRSRRPRTRNPASA